MKELTTQEYKVKTKQAFCNKSCLIITTLIIKIFLPGGKIQNLLVILKNS